MTKVQQSFALTAPLDEACWNRIAEIYKIYGILRVVVEPDGRKLTVEYDATRFSPKEVAALLAQAGIPVAQPAPV